MQKIPWNKDKAVGAKKAFRPDEVAMIEKMLARDKSTDAIRNLALFRFAIDTLLRSSDILSVKVGQVYRRGEVVEDFMVRQTKTKKPLTCYLDDRTRKAVSQWLKVGWDFHPDPEDRLFPISPRTYRRIVKGFAEMLRLDPEDYSTHSMRRTKAKEIYRVTKNLEVVRQALGQSSLGATSAYLGIDKEDAEKTIRSVKI